MLPLCNCVILDSHNFTGNWRASSSQNEPESFLHAGGHSSWLPNCSGVIICYLRQYQWLDFLMRELGMTTTTPSFSIALTGWAVSHRLVELEVTVSFVTTLIPSTQTHRGLVSQSGF